MEIVAGVKQDRESKLEELFLNPEIRAKSGMVSGTSWNSNTKNQEPNEDRYQKDPWPEFGTAIYWSPQSMNSDPKEASYRNVSLYDSPQ